MATTILKPAKTPKPKKTSEERKAALTLRSMGKRGDISLCIHGINEKYCKTCLAKKAAKSGSKASAAAKLAAKAE